MVRRYKIGDEHIESASNKGPRGTPQYASSYSHMGMTISRGEYCQSLLYILLELRNGILPWGDIRDEDTMVDLNRITHEICQSYKLTLALLAEHKAARFSIGLLFVIPIAKIGSNHAEVFSSRVLEDSPQISIVGPL